MRTDLSRPVSRDSDEMGLGAVLTGYAAIAAIALCFAVLLLAGHRYASEPKPARGVQADTLGVEELVDLFGAEPALLRADWFGWPKPRPVTRAELDIQHTR